MRGVTPIPSKIFGKIEWLWKLKYTIQVYPKKGFPILVENTSAIDLEHGKTFRKTQTEKAKKKRGKISDDGETMREVIERLALIHREESAKRIWPHFFSELESLGLEPESIYDPEGLEQWTYTYDFLDRRKKITLKRFADVISEFRRNKKSF
jgi:hypothetical protein